jgi:hypothetical protein
VTPDGPEPKRQYKRTVPLQLRVCIRPKGFQVVESDDRNGICCCRFQAADLQGIV